MADAAMPTTRVTLLARLRQDPTDQAAWDVFVERYGRHIYVGAGGGTYRMPTRRT
jgi:hypothetical protein